VRTIVAVSLVLLLALVACAGTDSAAPAAEASPGEGDAAAGSANDGSTTAMRAEAVRIVTLGDGYTAGTDTAAPRRDSWPSQLAEAMRRNGSRVLLWNLAERSQTSDDVLSEQLSEVGAYEPHIVTLQVGVNDIVTGETERYGENLEQVFDRLLADLPPERIFAITTPDHTLTAWARSRKAAGDERAAVEALNDTLRDVAGSRGIEVIDISSVYALSASDDSLVIDGRPSGTRKQYAGWVELIGLRVQAAVAPEDA
jgi:lysophospholipase L1-like esterase